MGSHQSRVEGQNPLPWPAGHASFDAACDTAGFLGWKCWLGHCWLMSSFYSPGSPSPSWQGCSQTIHPPVCIDTGDFPDPGAGPCTWPFVNIRLFAWAQSSSLSRSLWMASRPSSESAAPLTQLVVICKLAEGAFIATGYVINEDIKQCWSQQRAVRDTTLHWFPLGHWASDYNSLDVATHLISYPSNSPSFISSVATYHFFAQALPKGDQTDSLSVLMSRLDLTIFQCSVKATVEHIPPGIFQNYNLVTLARISKREAWKSCLLLFWPNFKSLLWHIS